MHRCPSLSSHPISRIESCIPISIVLQSPFLYYFLPFLLPPPTFLLLVALPRTPCITIISLQLSASSAGELHFCKDAPYTRWVNEPDVRLLFLFLFLLHMLRISFFFLFSSFFEFVHLFILRRKRGGRMDGCWIGGNEATTTSIVSEADDSIYRSCVFCCICCMLFERVERIRIFIFYLREKIIFILFKRFKFWWKSN